MGNTNLTNRLAVTHDPVDVVEVYSAADLPAMVLAGDGFMRTPYALAKKYIAKKTFVWPRFLIPTDPSPGPTFTEITSDHQGVTILIDGDETPHIWGRDIGNLRISNSILIDISNGGAGRGTVLFDLDGQGPDIAPVNPQGVLFLTTVGFGGFLEMGHTSDVAVSIDSSGWFFPERGLVIRGVEPSLGQLLATFTHVQAGPPMTTPMLTYQGFQSTMSANAGIVQLNAGDSDFHIDSASPGTYEFLGVTYQGSAIGSFFRPDISKAITAFTNVDIVFDSVVDSTVNPGVDSTIEFSGIQKFVRGQNVFLEGDAVATYDGPHTIVRVAADQSSFDINVAIGATDTGNVKITRVTAVGHGLVKGETQTRTGSTSYNQTDEVLFRVNNDNYDIPQPHVADDGTGTVTSTGKNNMSLGVDVRACGSQQDSKTIGGCHVNGGSNTTALDASTWTDLDLTGNLAVANSNIQRFTLTNSTTGELRYDEDKPFSGNILCTITLQGFSSQDDYEFRGFLNDSVHLDGINPATSTNINLRAITLLVPVNNLVKNDLIRVQVQNTSGSDNVIIREMNFTVL